MADRTDRHSELALSARSVLQRYSDWREFGVRVPPSFSRLCQRVALSWWWPSHNLLLQLSMLFTEECDKVRDTMHVHSFSYDFHLRVVHQYLVGCHMTLRQGYQLTDFLDDFISHHPDIPKFGRNHVFQGDSGVADCIRIPCDDNDNVFFDSAMISSFSTFTAAARADSESKQKMATQWTVYRASKGNKTRIHQKQRPEKNKLTNEK